MRSTHDDIARHAGFVRALAVHLLGDPHDGADVAQDALAAAISRPSEPRGLRRWLAGVVRNRARMFVRAEGRRRRHEAREARRSAANVASPIDVASRLEIQRRVVEALEQLEEPYRRTLVALFYDGLRPRELARRDGVPVATVRTRRARALARVRARLDAGSNGRHGWVVALLPLVGSRDATPTATGGAGAVWTEGVLMGLKATIAAGVGGALVGGAAVFAVMRDAPRPPDASSPAVRHVVRDEAPVGGGTEGGRDTASAGNTVERERPALPSREDADSYLARINDPREPAKEVAVEIAALPPERGLEIMRSIFDRIVSPANRIAVLGPFTSEPHARVVRVLDLGARDAISDVQNTALELSARLFLRRFAEDYEAYRDWVASNADRPIADVLAEARRAYVDRLWTARGDALLREIELARKPAALVDYGLPDLVETWIAGPTVSIDAKRKALRIATQLPLPDDWYRRVVLPQVERGPGEDGDVTLFASACSTLAQPGRSWAVEPLLDVLLRTPGGDRLDVSGPAHALGVIGDARAIPTLIGILESETSYATVYGIGHFALGKLTGVAYDESHDGAWWRTWWEKNRRRFPSSVANREIPRVSLPKRGPR